MLEVTKVINEFDALKDWEAKYKKIIDLGKALEPLPESEKKDELKVRGCQSQVWLKAGLDSERRVVFHGESDSLIAQGLLALLLRVYSRQLPKDILETPPDFLEEIGLKKHLSPNRANGVYAMVKQIYLYAQAFQALSK